jgi:hypothetical protein
MRRSIVGTNRKKTAPSSLSSVCGVTRPRRCHASVACSTRHSAYQSPKYWNGTGSAAAMALNGRARRGIESA